MPEPVTAMSVALRRVLKAYMEHIGHEEGVDFLLPDTPQGLRDMYGGPLSSLTDGELQILLQVRDEINEEGLAEIGAIR